ncbi:MAG: amidohydrolase family protein [Gammaproteobacteria bacterium]|nr:amidohydrolase family protein [Gammaproteobacteria bacterium]
MNRLDFNPVHKSATAPIHREIRGIQHCTGQAHHHRLLSKFLLLLPLLIAPLVANADSLVTRYSGGQIFDGKEFRARELCVRDTGLVACPSSPDVEVRVDGAFLTPPVGDAHTHHFDGPGTLAWHTSIAFKSGTFYAMNMTAMTSQVALIRDRMGGPDYVDAISSTGGITGPESHPAEIYEALALGAYSYEDQLKRTDEIRASRKVADDAYYVVESEQQLAQKWPLILAGKPDFIKVFLRSSERYDEGFGKWGPGGGIDPRLLPLIREQSHSAGLRLAVANSSIDDFRASLAAQADIVTHLPCYQDSSQDPTSPYYDTDSAEECLISSAEAGQAAAQGMSVVLIVTEWAKERPAEQVQWERQNLDTLRAAGVRFAIGSNAYGSTLTEGLMAGMKKEFLPPTELLRVATMDTPSLIFPERQVGCLDVGCEASFIAFGGNPLEDEQQLANIVLRVKDGNKLAVD